MDQSPPTSQNPDIEHLGRVPSTQSLARARLPDLSRPTMFVAQSQSGGVGRFGRPWSSPVGGLWATLAWPDGNLDGLGLRVGVASVKFVRQLVSEPAKAHIRLKWPNDVVIDGRKVLGVLCEAVRGPGDQPWVLVGVGLNANFEVDQLPNELRSGATTLLTALGATTDLHSAAEALARRLAGALTDTGPSAATVATARDMLHGVCEESPVSLPTGEKVSAMLIGLGADGNPVFEQDGSRWAAPGGTVIEHPQ